MKTHATIVNAVFGSLVFLVMIFAPGEGWGQTTTQNFGTGTGSNTSQTGVTNLFPTPTGTGTITTYARAGATAPNAPVVLSNTSNPLGTTGSFVRAVSSSSASVTKVSPIVSYASGLEFYTSFKVLFGNSSAGSTATSGSWTFSQGAGAFFSDNNAYATLQVFTGLRFAFGASGALTLAFDNSGTFSSTGLTTSSFSQATIYTIEIIGNNKTAGTISYTYNGGAQTVAVQKFDLYINGTLIGNDLTKGNATANTNVNATSFTGINSTSNVANLFLDDVVIYNAVPASIGSSGSTPPTLSAVASQTVDNNFNITFTDDPTWRAAVTGITVDGTSYLAASGVYSLTSGSLVLTTASIAQLQTAGSHTIIVLATGYTNASVTQTNIAGVATKLGMKTQPTAPASNGAVLATQPAVYIQDQYGNTTTSTADVVAAVGAGTWTLGGTTTVAAVAGTTTYSGLTATSTAAVTGATIAFTCTGLTGVTSATFNIPAPIITLTAASGATVDSPFDVTFIDNASWRAAITSITVGGTTLTSGYLVSSGKITFTPSASVPTNLLQSSGNKSIVVIATGYSNSTVTQAIGVGAANKLGMKTQPTAPASNGAVLATQPAVYIQDQYGNTTTSTADVIAAVGAGTWTIGGTTTVAAVAGTTTYSGLTATSSAAVTGATIAFTCSGLTGVTSGTFNIPAPLTNDECITAISITPGDAPIAGSNVGATKSNPSTLTVSSYTIGTAKDVWYTFTPTCTGSHTITVTPTAFDVAIALFSGGTCPNPPYTSDADNSGSGIAESITASLTAGITYRVLVWGYSSASGGFTIGVTGPTPVTQTVSSSAATSITETTATLNGNVTVLGVCPSTTEKGFVYSATATNSDPLVAGVGVTKTVVSGVATGTFILDIASLTGASGYSFKPYVYDGSSYTYGSVTTFTTTTSAPSATAANVVSSTGFTANWDVKTGASSYKIDVSTNINFAANESIVSEGFENATPLFTRSGGSFYSGNSGTGDLPASSPFAVAGTYSFGISSGTAILTSSDINTSNHTSNQLSFRLASFSITSIGNGADAGDIVTVEVSPNGGANYYNTVRVLGNSNAVWSYAGGAANASTAYDGDATPVSFAPAGGGNRTTDGYSTVVITGLPVASNLKIKITLLNDNANERWLVDDLKVTGNLNTMVSGYNDLTVNSTSQVVTGLSENTPYYYRVRAVNAGGTSLNSNTITTTTLSTLSTTDATGISIDGATTGGNIAVGGGGTIYARGVCYSTATTPTIAGSHTTDASGTGIFTSTLSGLAPNTKYYIRAYATNAEQTGTAYGDEKNFTTTASSTCSFTGSTGGSWEVASNWDNGLPGAITNVTIPAGKLVVVNTYGECNNLTIASLGKLTINNPSTGLDVNGDFLIKSDANGTGSIVYTAGDFTVAGSNTVERYIPAALWTVPDDGWHLLSSPVAVQNIAPGFTAAAGEYDIYAWDEPHNVWVNYLNETSDPKWSSVNNPATDFLVGIGYLVDYKNTSTKSFTGTLNATDKQFSNMTVSGGTNNSWHLLGNPYASGLTWYTDWTRSNIGGVANIWNSAAKAYTPVNAGEVIPSGNGFMVYVGSATNSITIPAAKRTHGDQNWYKSTNYPVVKLFATNIDYPSYQESQVRFNPASSNDFDLEFDGRFLSGYAPQFYSVAGDNKLMVNSLPDLSSQTSIPFAFIPNEGTSFKIEASGLESVFAQAWLLDKKTNTDHNLSLNPAYNFTSSTGDSPDRFVLHFSGVGMGETTIAETITVYSAGNTINISSKTGALLNGNVYIYNMIGQLIHSQTLSGGNLTKITLNTLTGYYLVKVVTADHTISTKVFFN